MFSKDKMCLRGIKCGKHPLCCGNKTRTNKNGTVMRAFQKYSDVDLTFIHSGQHYDANMSKIFTKELGLPRPAQKHKCRLRQPRRTNHQNFNQFKKLIGEDISWRFINFKKPKITTNNIP